MDDVRALYSDLLDAWNRRDAKGYAALFVHSGQIVGFDGSQVSAEHLAEHLDGIFADHPTSPYVAKVRWVRPLGPDAALLTYDLMVHGAIAGHQLPQRLYASSVWVQRNGHWLAVLHQETPAHHS